MKKPIELLAEARGIIGAMKMGAISYDQAKIKTSPILREYNSIAKEVSKKYGRKWYDISFAKLAR